MTHLRILISSTLAALFLLLTSNSGVAQQRYRGTGLATVGEQAPDFELKKFDGGSFTLSTVNRSHPVVVWFTNMCKGCQSQIPAFIRLRAEYQKRGVEFVAVSMLGNDRKTAEGIIKQYHVPYPVLYDPTGSASQRWSGKYVKGTCPLQNIFVIAKDGRILLADHLPGIDIADLTDAIKGTLETGKK